MGVYKRGKNYFIDYYAGPKRFKEMVGPNRRGGGAGLGRKQGVITEEEIEAYRAQRKDVPTKADNPAARRPRSNSTLNHELSILKQLFSKAIAWGYLEKGKNTAG